MPAPSFKIYVAVSVDGFIATPDGGVDWLDAFHGGDSDYGYAEFVAGIATVGRTMRAFLDLGAVDRVDLFVMPVILGGGIPLFGASSRHHRLPAPEVEAYPDGVVRLPYAPG